MVQLPIEVPTGWSPSVPVPETTLALQHDPPNLVHVEVSWNRGYPPVIHFRLGFSLINHPLGVTPFMETLMYQKKNMRSRVCGTTAFGTHHDPLRPECFAWWKAPKTVEADALDSWTMTNPMIWMFWVLQRGLKESHISLHKHNCFMLRGAREAQNSTDVPVVV